jgi:hypothetical protein
MVICVCMYVCLLSNNIIIRDYSQFFYNSTKQSPKPNIFRSAAARRLFWPSAAAANRLTPKFLPRRLGGGAAAFIGGQPKTRYIFEF